MNTAHFPSLSHGRKVSLKPCPASLTSSVETEVTLCRARTLVSYLSESQGNSLPIINVIKYQQGGRWQSENHVRFTPNKTRSG